MDTVTEEPPKPPKEREASPPGAAAVIDPEHDIDAKTTIAWLTAAVVFVAICMWALFQFFAFSVEEHQREKIDAVLPEELRALRVEEAYALRSGEPADPENPEGRDLDGKSLSEIDADLRDSTNRIIRSYVNK